MLLFKTHKIPPPFILLNFNQGIAILCLKTRASPGGGSRGNYLTGFQSRGATAPLRNSRTKFSNSMFLPPCKITGGDTAPHIRHFSV